MRGLRWSGTQSAVAVDGFEFDDWAEPVRLLTVADEAAEFGASTVGPQYRAHVFECDQRFTQSCGGAFLLALTTLNLAEPK